MEEEFKEKDDEFYQRIYKKIAESDTRKRELNGAIIKALENKNMFVTFLPVSKIEPEGLVIDTCTNIRYEQVGFGIIENGILIAPCLAILIIDKWLK